MKFSFRSPIGDICLSGDFRAITSIDIGLQVDSCNCPDIFYTAREQLEEYFLGKRREFDFPIKPIGTKFQLSVWELVRQIPYGCTASYGELAALLGNPRACRAVGNAVGRNPLPIVIPCHRVVAANGIGGFSCGLEIKRKLFIIENISI